MAVQTIDIARILTERIEAAHPAPALFDADEVSRWPAGVLAQLLKSRVLSEARRASAIKCPGCERQCHEAVTVRRAPQGSRAYINCYYGYGRVGVPLSALKQYEASLCSMATFVASSIGASEPKGSKHGASYAIGQVAGRNGERDLLIALNDGHVVIWVGRQSEELVRILAWADRGFVTDLAHLRRLANRKETSLRKNPAYQPDRSVQEGRAGDTRKRNLGILRKAKALHHGGCTWTDAAKQIGRELKPPLAASTVRRIIHKERRRERENSPSKRRERK